MAKVKRYKSINGERVQVTLGGEFFDEKGDKESYENRIKDLEERLAFFENIFLREGNDIRVQNKIRDFIIIKEHTAGKPQIKASTGKLYNLQIV